MAWTVTGLHSVGQPAFSSDSGHYEYFASQVAAVNAEREKNNTLPMSSSTGIGDGLNYPMSDKPIVLTFPMNTKPYLARFPSIFFGFSTWFVTEEFINAVERIEPGVHRYWDVETRFEDGSPTDRKRWMLESMSFIETLDIERSELVVLHKDRSRPDQPPLEFGYQRASVMDSDSMEYRKEKAVSVFLQSKLTKGRALWTEKRLMSSPLIFSDDLADALQNIDAGRLGLDSYLREV